MILLPQRKKSSAEIAKLRESLGIPGLAPDSPPASPQDPPPPVTEIPAITTTAPSSQPAGATPLTPLPAPAQHDPKQFPSLKRSDRIPVLPPDELQSAAPPTAAAAPPAHSLKSVRSLRKSEQSLLPVMPHAAPGAASILPSHRHSAQEIEAIRQREALALLTPVVNPKLAAAHPALLVPGYLAALAAAALIYFYQQPITLSAPCAAVSLLIAGFIALKKPISRHHAAFIAVITLFVIIFGALHYFPQLRHAT